MVTQNPTRSYESYYDEKLAILADAFDQLTAQLTNTHGDPGMTVVFPQLALLANESAQRLIEEVKTYIQALEQK